MTFEEVFFSIKLYVCNLMLPFGIVTIAAVCHMLHFQFLPGGPQFQVWEHCLRHLSMTVWQLTFQVCVGNNIY